ncbi:MULTISPECIES: sugar dehydrogenase complex small subunit [Tatumella]|uniref:Membrane-bound 2-keto-D-gluconate dehydrogenase, gamma subunit n=2 Tax=Tatumella ptyseos TaxID=82987 RepID=A0A085JEP8_9GAMM|nr:MULTISPECIES: sugar dehydrogenase complex small subunit [Tatumella]KFD18944.1 membrane-bound 2-keto-D-gluconate dehydrogenase, gamma subunit [Tatumella ptyseos ATCC 33301]SQK74898.1 Membrane bound FAD containing D-sorbitol dehydrogenase [Tatumella ptyseos]
MDNKNYPATEPALSEEGLRRRRLFGQTGGLVASFAIGSAIAGATLSNSASAEPATPQPDTATLNQFLKTSRFLTGHQSLDTTLGQRLYSAFSEKDPTFVTRLASLNQWIADKNPQDVEALDTQLQGQPLHDLMMSVIKGWYLGVTDEGHHAKVYGYQNALMYQVPRDGMVIPTYAHNGPDYWTADPPPVDRLLNF